MGAVRADMKKLIATWFVSDDAADGTFFPQIGRLSSDPGAKAIYWRCVVAFYATSLLHNEGCSHVFFTNTGLPTLDGLDVAKLLEGWGVEVVKLPITYRLPRGSVDRWGNQFYIFDIVKYLVTARRWDSAVVLDSDIVWTESAEQLHEAIERDGIVTYMHDLDAYPEGVLINGASRASLVAFMNRHDKKRHDRFIYCGGEFFAATLDAMDRMFRRLPPLWEEMMRCGDGPKEEAHLLSILYLLEGYPMGNGNRFIKRLWTTFKYNTVEKSDYLLPLWHLPSEKRYGYVALFAHMKRNGLLRYPRPAELKLERAQLGKQFGIPRRTGKKLVVDLAAKVREKTGLFGA